ncbi:MAG: MGMT family protein [Chloroflexota bacterium]
MNMFYAYCVAVEVPSDFGPVRLAATDRGVAALAMLSTAEGFDAGLVRRGLVVAPADAGPRAGSIAAQAAEAVRVMLEGDVVDFDLLPVDLGDRPAWDQLILGVVRTIPRGTTLGYGDVARLAGRPGAAQATGGAVGRNPVGLLILPPRHCGQRLAGRLRRGGLGRRGGRAGPQGGAARARGRGHPALIRPALAASPRAVIHALAARPAVNPAHVRCAVGLAQE